MLLNALKAYYESPDAAAARTPPMYGEQPILYIVELAADGRYLGLTTTATAAKGREARGARFVAPLVGTRTVGIKANLLVDNAEYALGIKKGTSTDDQVRQRHATFVAAVRACAAATGSAEVTAVLRLLERLPTDPFIPPPDFKPAENVAFRVDGVLPFELPAVQVYWARVNGAGGDEVDGVESGEAMPCLLCGEPKPVLARIPFKHKNIPGGQTSGTALISANASAFGSYGLKESLIAPVCFACAEAFSNGLNALIAGETTHLRRDPLLYVFWARQGGFTPRSLLDNADPSEVQALLRAAEVGAATAPGGVDAERFYALSLAGSGGRLAVRDWMDVTVGEVRANLARYFRQQDVVDPYAPDERKPFAIWRLAGATVRDPRKDAPAPGVARALYRAALGGGPVPLDVLFAAVRRFRAEQGRDKVSRARAALVKLVLLSQPESPWKENQMVGLEREERAPAYLCGRLLAVLENAQQQALGDPGATIVDRFYGAASSTPVAVFGRLVRGAQPHLARLRRDRPGAYRALQREIEEICAALPVGERGAAFPAALTLSEQGLFALGYYHQRAERFAHRPADPAAQAAQPATGANP